MKGLNVKRIAALGLGAALVGSALAPVVMAAAYSNLTEKLTSKSQIIDATTGAPVVDVVVGTIGKPIDVVWAGNIAAKVAQMATVPTGSATATVDAVVNATGTSVAGVGRELDKYFGDSTLSPINSGISDVPSFAQGSVSIKYPTLNDGAYTDLAVDENVSVSPTFGIQTDASKDLAGQLVSEVNTGDVVYSASYGEGIPFSAGATETSLDSNTNVDLQIPFMGKTYTISEIHSSSATNVSDIVLFASTTPSTLKVGESVTVQGAGSYAGKTLTAVLKNIYVSGAGTQTYNATWDLMDGTTVIKEQSVASSTGSYDLKDTFGSSYLTSSVYVTNVALDVVANSYYASIRTGTDRLEIKNNDVFPYTSSVNSVNKLWNAKINAVGSRILSIQVTNNRAEWLKSDMTNLNSSQGRYGPVGMGDSFNIPGMDYLKYEFIGLESKPMYNVTIGNEQLVIPDTKGIQRTIPFIIQLNKGQNNITVGGKDITIDVNENTKDVRVWNRNVNDVTTAYDSNDSGSVYIDGNVSAAPVKLQVSADWKNSDSGYVDYLIAAYPSTNRYYLLLDKQTFDVYGTDDGASVSGSNGELKFLGTDLYGDTVGSPTLGYYMPDMQTYNFVDTNQGLTAHNISDEGDNYVKSAEFTWNERTNVVSAVQAVSIFVDTSTGSLINTQDNKDKAPTNEVTSGYGSAVHINENTTSAASKLLGFGTAYGSEISADSQVLTISKPSEARKIQEFLGSTSTADTNTTPTGGTTETGVTVGQTIGNVTITNINAPTAGVTVTKVSNLVKADTDVAGAKSILVGGWMANTRVAADLTVTIDGTGQKLNDLLKTDSDYVAAVLDSGSIVVAGWSADGVDTASAAQALIAALDRL